MQQWSKGREEDMICMFNRNNLMDKKCGLMWLDELFMETLKTMLHLFRLPSPDYRGEATQGCITFDTCICMKKRGSKCHLTSLLKLSVWHCTECFQPLSVSSNAGLQSLQYVRVPGELSGVCSHHHCDLIQSRWSILFSLWFLTLLQLFLETFMSTLLLWTGVTGVKKLSRDPSTVAQFGGFQRYLQVWSKHLSLHLLGTPG